MVSTLTPGEKSPTRVAAQVASGIGFLGGGVILREGFSIRGLNTAATLWCAAAVGSLAGCGIYAVSILGTLAVVIANLGLRPLALLVNAHPGRVMETELKYQCLVTCRAGNEAAIRSLLSGQFTDEHFELRELSTDRSPDGTVQMRAILNTTDRRDDALIERIIGAIAKHPDVTMAGWSIVEGHTDSV